MKYTTKGKEWQPANITSSRCSTTCDFFGCDTSFVNMHHMISSIYTCIGSPEPRCFLYTSPCPCYIFKFIFKKGPPAFDMQWCALVCIAW